MSKQSEYQEYKGMIDDMRLDEDYEFAEDTLSGILETIEERQQITENQKVAIDNILNSKPFSETYNNWRN